MDRQHFHGNSKEMSKNNPPTNGEAGVVSRFIDPRGWTQLHLDAAGITGSGTLKPLPHEYSDTNLKGPAGLTPLMLACSRGGDSRVEDNTKMIIYLLERGADLNMKSECCGETPLHLAARFSRTDAVKVLIEREADVNLKDNTGRTPLHSAIAAEAQGAFQALLRNRATDLDAQSYDGATPLILAVQHCIGMVEALIKCKATVNACDNQGKTALHWAASVNNPDAIQILISHGANINVHNKNEETPLFLAAREGHCNIVELLLKNSADSSITDNLGRSPRDVALEKIKFDVVRLLDESPKINSPNTISRKRIKKY